MALCAQAKGDAKGSEAEPAPLPRTHTAKQNKVRRPPSAPQAAHKRTKQIGSGGSGLRSGLCSGPFVYKYNNMWPLPPVSGMPTVHDILPHKLARHDFDNSKLGDDLIINEPNWASVMVVPLAHATPPGMVFNFVTMACVTVHHELCGLFPVTQEYTTFTVHRNFYEGCDYDIPLATMLHCNNGRPIDIPLLCACPIPDDIHIGDIAGIYITMYCACVPLSIEQLQLLPRQRLDGHVVHGAAEPLFHATDRTGCCLWTPTCLDPSEMAGMPLHLHPRHLPMVCVTGDVTGCGRETGPPPQQMTSHAGRDAAAMAELLQGKFVPTFVPTECVHRDKESEQNDFTAAGSTPFLISLCIPLAFLVFLAFRVFPLHSFPCIPCVPCIPCIPRIHPAFPTLPPTFPAPTPSSLPALHLGFRETLLGLHENLHRGRQREAHTYGGGHAIASLRRASLPSRHASKPSLSYAYHRLLSNSHLLTGTRQHRGHPIEPYNDK